MMCLGSIITPRWVVSAAHCDENCTMMCLGSLITPRWVVSAAHCNDYISNKVEQKKCAAATARGETFRKDENKVILIRESNKNGMLS
jgi:secreted trypsin-like serine protease